MGVISNGMIFEEDINEFFFADGQSVLDDAIQQIGIVFPDDGIRGPVTLAWNGMGLDGEPLSNGAYIVKVESVDSLGITTVVTGTASILRSGSTVTVRVFNEAGELVWSSTQTGQAVGQSEVEIQGDSVDPTLPAGSPGSTLNIVLGTLNVSWSGTDQQGRPLANGEYLVEVRVENAGQESVITDTVTVLNGPPMAVSPVVLAPNPVASGSPVEIRASLASNKVASIRVRAYTVSAELVRTLSAASDSVTWDLKDGSGSPVAAGLYVLVVEASAPGGAPSKSIARLVVMR